MKYHANNISKEIINDIRLHLLHTFPYASMMKKSSVKIKDAVCNYLEARKISFDYKEIDELLEKIL